jgi:hypothetical protein
MIKHIVMWTLKDEAAGADRAANARKMKEMLEALRGVVPSLAALEVGVEVFAASPACDVPISTPIRSTRSTRRWWPLSSRWPPRAAWWTTKHRPPVRIVFLCARPGNVGPFVFFLPWFRLVRRLGLLSMLNRHS